MIGFHVSKAGRKMPVAFEQDMEMLSNYGFKDRCAQIFISGPRDFNPMNQTELEGVKIKIAQLAIPVYVHGAYVDNPWTMNKSSIENIISEMQNCYYIGARGLVVHLAKSAVKDDVLFDVLNSLSSLSEDIKRNVVLYFEIHTAKSSIFTYETPDKLYVLFQRIQKVLNENALNLRVGLCIDSAHLFACGYAMVTYDDTMQWLNTVSKYLNNVPFLFHLNDSASKLGSGIDKHAALTHGNIWGNFNAITGTDKLEASGIYAIINWCAENNTPIILERDADGLISDLKLLSRKN